MNFSQRIGKTPATKTIQLEDMDIELRNCLWNAVKYFLIDKLERYNTYSQTTNDTEFLYLCEALWHSFYKLPIDTIPQLPSQAELFIRERFFTHKWYEIYDLLEFITMLNFQMFSSIEFKKFCNRILENENSAYRFIEDRIAPITNATETKEIEEAIILSGKFSALSGANIHLKSALNKIADKKNPDYRNSIKESISAVENVAKKISGSDKGKLSDALAKIKSATKIHTSLEEGFKKIYGYTSDGAGIRHALMEESTCDFEDAKFMLVSCSAFINYLISKSDKVGIKFIE